MACAYYEDFSDLALFAASPATLLWPLLVLVHQENGNATRSGGLVGCGGLTEDVFNTLAKVMDFVDQRDEEEVWQHIRDRSERED